MATFRDELVRAVFEARRDVTWWEIVEPNLRDNGFDADEIKDCREAWNEKREKHDWACWQKEAQRFSNSVLDDMRMDFNDRLDQLGMLQWVREKAAGEREKLRQVFGDTPVREEKPQGRSKNIGRER